MKTRVKNEYVDTTFETLHEALDYIVNNNFEKPEQLIVYYNERWHTTLEASLHFARRCIEVLKPTVDFYANKENYIAANWGDCDTPYAIPVEKRGEEGTPCDCGDRARAAIEAMQKI